MLRRLIAQVQRRGWRCFARFSSDPKTLTPVVCPFLGKIATSTVLLDQ